MTKLTRKEKKEIRIKMRCWLASVIRGSDIPAEQVNAHEGNEEALAYMQHFKSMLAEDMDFYGEDSEPLT